MTVRLTSSADEEPFQQWPPATPPAEHRRARSPFTGRDTAAGKSWEAWMKKYAEKKARGDKDLSLYSESLEE